MTYAGLGQTDSAVEQQLTTLLAQKAMSGNISFSNAEVEGYASAASGYAAAGACVAAGAGVAAPICNEVGKTLGKAVYGAVSGAFGGSSGPTRRERFYATMAKLNPICSRDPSKAAVGACSTRMGELTNYLLDHPGQCFASGNSPVACIAQANDVFNRGVAFEAAKVKMHEEKVLVQQLIAEKNSFVNEWTPKCKTSACKEDVKGKAFEWALMRTLVAKNLGTYVTQGYTDDTYRQQMVAAVSQGAQDASQSSDITSLRRVLSDMQSHAAEEEAERRKARRRLVVIGVASVVVVGVVAMMAARK